MNKEMIISSGDHDTRVAILEEDQVVEIFIERENQRGVVGNIYKGRVSKVLPGMQSSFVDIGLERDAFLYVTEVVNTVEEFEKLAGDEEDEGKPPELPEVPAAADDGAAVPAADGAGPEQAPAPSKTPERRGRDRDRDRDQPQAKIEDLLKEGQEILVQVVKEPLGTKGARLTSHVTMPGRFLVFMPTVDHVGVSRKIESREERSRLRNIVKQFREQHGFTGGVIIRTAASGRSEADIVADLSYFHEIWTEVRRKMENRRPPAVLFQEQSLVTKLLRDMLTEDFQAIRLDDEAEHRRVVALVERRCHDLGVSCVVGRARRRVAGEANWRAQRWGFLRRVARDSDAKVATAHTRDDQVETVFMRLLRDAGPRGLAGLYARSDVLRPLLGTSRTDVEAYARDLSIAYVHDPSNLSRRHLRNRVRHDILPAIVAARPAFPDELLDLAARAAAWRESVAAIVDALGVELHADGSLSVACRALESYDERELAILWPEIAARMDVTMDRRGTHRVAAFTIHGATGGSIQLSGGIEVVRTRTHFVLRRKAP